MTDAYQILSRYPELASIVRRELERAEQLLTDTGMLVSVAWLVSDRRVFAEALDPMLSPAEMRAWVREHAQDDDHLVLIYPDRSRVDDGPVLRIVMQAAGCDALAFVLPLAPGSVLAGPHPTTTWLPERRRERTN